MKVLTAVGSVALALLGLTMTNAEIESPIRSDEVVEWFPTYAFRDAESGSWQVPLHGWIYEPEDDGRVRRALLSGVRRALGLEKSGEDTELFRARARRFLVDNERGKRVPVRIAGRVVRLPPSGTNGHLQSTVALPADALETLGEGGGWIRVEAVPPPSDSRSFAGRVRAVGPKGISVISDVDDTIKITEVHDEKKMLENTFLRPYAPVEALDRFYRELEASGAAFHFVSNSPWQLCAPLREFAERAGFPAGSWHLRRFRLKDRSFIEFVRSKGTHKRDTIRALFERFPERSFVLIGDTGEHDPEIYGEFVREFGERVEFVILRDPVGTADIEARVAKALDGLPRNRWRVFRDATTLRWPLR